MGHFMKSSISRLEYNKSILYATAHVNMSMQLSSFCELGEVLFARGARESRASTHQFLPKDFPMTYLSANYSRKLCWKASVSIFVISFRVD